jgi:predicted DNA-binding transcriptional regulator
MPAGYIRYSTTGDLEKIICNEVAQLFRTGTTKMSEISADLKQFIWDTFTTIEQLQIFLLLYNSRKKMEDTEISRALHLSPEHVKEKLLSLVKVGLVSVVNSGEQSLFEYDFERQERNNYVNEITKMDREKPVTLIKLIYSRI